MIIPGHVRVFRAPMPEAPVHEHSHSLQSKSKVRSAGQRQMPPLAGDFVLAQQFCERSFGVLVATAADAGHDGGALGFGENVRHFQVSPRRIVCGPRLRQTH